LSYNPNTLAVFNDGGIWILTDGSSRMVAFASEDAAQLGLQVARLHTQHCFIGRGNSRPDRQSYIFDYWQGNSGLGGSLPTNDCLGHDRSALYIVDEGANGWLLTDGASRMVMFDNQMDAQRGLDLIRNYDQICYIGRGTGRIMTYLRSTVVLGEPPVAPPGEDCLSYDAFALVLNDQGATGWTVTSGSSSMVLLDNVNDAQLAAQVAMAHTQQCFIGRDNARPNRYAYIFEYWKGDSGLGLAPPLGDCLEYNPATLAIADNGADGWRVSDGMHSILLLDDQSDALAAHQVMLSYNMICFIGRGNSRADRDRYVHTYLRTAPVSGGLPVPTATPAPALPPCASAPMPRMLLNRIGRVTYTTGEPVRVRTGPGTGNAILTLLPEGTIFYVNGGPVCSDPYWWWSMQTSTGISGWMAEGVVGNYFIEPFSP
jgi:hypothetical protein